MHLRIVLRTSFGQLFLLSFLGLVALVQPGHSQGGGPPGGHIRTLAIDPVNTDTVYAGIDRGGVYKSTDGGANWSAVSSGLRAPISFGP